MSRGVGGRRAKNVELCFAENSIKIDFSALFAGFHPAFWAARLLTLKHLQGVHLHVPLGPWGGMARVNTWETTWDVGTRVFTRSCTCTRSHGLDTVSTRRVFNLSSGALVCSKSHVQSRVQTLGLRCWLLVDACGIITAYSSSAYSSRQQRPPLGVDTELSEIV